MVKKISGYILAGLGIVGLISSLIPNVREILPIPEEITQITIIIGSLILVVLGVTLIGTGGTGGGKTSPEVPIYKGKQIVGYRRH
jgi:hypothetical protein